MTKADLGLTSGVQDSTQQQNREKMQLINEIELLRKEKKKLSKEVINLLKGT